MAIKITEECINCGACELECPNNAIYEGAMQWSFSEGTSLKGDIKTFSGLKINANDRHKALSNDFFFIVTDKCTECIGFHEEPQCASVCPVNCCIKDENFVESKQELIKKKKFLHNN